MKGIRRFGLMIILLALGIFIGRLGTQATILIFSSLILLWFILWDEKKYRLQEHEEQLKAEQQQFEEYQHHEAYEEYEHRHAS